MKKRLLALLLTLVMLLSLFPAAAFAEGEGSIAPVEEDPTPAEPGEDGVPADPEEPVGEISLADPDAAAEKPVADEPAATGSGTCGDDLTWTLENGVLTISGTGEMWDFISSFGYPSSAPWEWGDCRTIVLEEGITSIGAGAFYSCSSLTDVTIPESVKSIGASAFSHCSSLTDVTIPDAVTSIGEGAFSDCSSLTAITVEEGNPAFAADDGILYNKEMSLLLQCPARKTGEIVIPAGVMRIGESAFSGCGSLTDIAISSTVTSIGMGAFSNCSSLTEMTIPEGVTSIERDSFYYCSSLTDITIPNTVTSIGNTAFCGCSSLTGITIPEGVTVIGPGAFSSCSSLTGITIPSTVTSIGNWAFGYCGHLLTIDFMGTKAQFQTADEGSYDRYTVTVRCTDGEILPGDPSHCGDDLTWELSDGVLTVSGTGEMWNFISNNQPWSGQKSEITAVVLEAGVTAVGSDAFFDCGNLSSVSLPDSLTRIGASAFFSCGKLDSLTIPAGVKSIGDGAFCQDSLELFFTGDAPTFADDVFAFCTVTAYYPEINATWTEDVLQDYTGAVTGNVTWTPYHLTVASGTLGSNLSWTMDDAGTLTISGEGEMPRYDWYPPNTTRPWPNGVRRLVIEEGVTSISEFAFNDSETLEEVWLASTVSTISYNVFYSCNKLTSFHFGKSRPSIEPGAFGFMGGMHIYLDGPISDWKALSVSSQGNTGLWKSLWHCSDGDYFVLGSKLLGSFEENGCLTITGSGSTWSYSEDPCRWGSTLTAVSLPAGITGIGAGTFSSAPNLTDVYFEGTLAQKKALDIASGNSALLSACWHCSDGNFTSCGDNLYWSYNKSTRVLTITGSGEMWDFVSPDDTWSLSNGETTAPWGQKIVSVSLPQGLTRIGNNAFYQCSQLRELRLPEGLKSIGYSAFYGCDGLSRIEIPDSVTEIGSSAFQDCSGLESARLPEGLTEISDYLFYGCGKLREIRIPAQVTSIGGYAFSQCRSLRSVELPAGLKTISYDAFEGCGSLERIDLPESLTTIGNSAFSYSGITEVVLPDSLRTLGSYVFSACVNLRSVRIPGTMSGIGAYAFASCGKLRTIVFEGEAPVIRGNAFTGVTATAFYPDDGSWWESDRQDFGGDITWVAYQGEAAFYTVSYDPNGGGLAPEAQTKPHGVTLVLSSAVPVRAGYRFLGWATASDASEPEYLPGGAYAADADLMLFAVWQQQEDASGPAILVENVPVVPGQTIEIPVKLENNPGIYALTVSFRYDTAALKLVAVTPNSNAFPGAWQTGSLKGASWASNAGNVSANDTILTLTFRVLDDAARKDYVVEVVPGEILNEEMEKIDFAAASGKVTVAAHIPGDVSGDGKVSTRDFVLLMKYLAQEDVVVNEIALDVSGDGNVTTMDLLLLMKYLAGEDVTIH